MKHFFLILFLLFYLDNINYSKKELKINFLLYIYLLQIGVKFFWRLIMNSR